MMIIMFLGDLIQRTAETEKLWREGSLCKDSGKHSELMPVAVVEQV